jgi:membrane protease subunit (stomatin/prohibitin family)
MGTVARTAVVAGTATVVAGGVQRHAEQRSAEQQAAQAQQQGVQAQQQQAAAQPRAAGQQAGPDDRLAKIKELGEMKEQGLLTEDEFAAEKARILNA